MTPLRLAWLSLVRRPLSTALALVAIALAVGGCGILLRLYVLMQNRFATIAKGGNAVIGAKAGGIDILLGALNDEGDYPGFLPYKLFETLRAQQAVHFEDGATSTPQYLQQVIPFLYCGMTHDLRVIATDSTFFNRQNADDNPAFAQGTFSDNADHSIVLGSSAAEKLAAHVGDKIEVHPWVGGSLGIQSGDGPPREFQVSGILKPTHSSWDRQLFTDVADGQNLISAEPALHVRSIWGSNVLNYFLLYLTPDGYQPLKDLINKRTVGQVIFVRHEKKHLEKLAGTGQTLGFVISILVILLGGLSVASMLVTRFDAMGVQLAVLRALGYTKGQVGLALLFEGFLLGVGACFIGIVIDLSGFPVLRWMLGSTLPAADVVHSSILQSSPVWLAAILATTMSVFLPLLKLYNQDVHRSLRN